jgi:hypothetical protein
MDSFIECCLRLDRLEAYRVFSIQAAMYLMALEELMN